MLTCFVSSQLYFASSAQRHMLKSVSVQLLTLTSLHFVFKLPVRSCVLGTFLARFYRLSQFCSSLGKDKNVKDSFLSMIVLGAHLSVITSQEKTPQLVEMRSTGKVGSP